MRESWTDDRLDDLNGKVDALRGETREEFAAVRAEMRDGFDRIEKHFDRMDERFEKRFERIDARFEVMDEHLVQIYRTMVGFCGAGMAALIGFIATQI